MSDINSAILERLEKVVDTLQENSVKMGQLLAVHNEKLDKQDRIDAVLFEKVESLHKDLDRSTAEIKKGCEKDSNESGRTPKKYREKDVVNRWWYRYYISISQSYGSEKALKGLQTQQNSVILESTRVVDLGSSRHKIHKFSISLDYKSFQRRVEDYTILDALIVGIPVSIRIRQGDFYIL